MAWNCIRRATSDEVKALDEKAAAFAERHNVETYEDAVTASGLVCVGIAGDKSGPMHTEENNKRLRKLWRAIVRRTLNHNSAEGIVGGYIGYHVD